MPEDDAAHDPYLGRELHGRYRIEALLGEGGVGRVYVARHLLLDRRVAVKVLRSAYEGLEVLRQRFQREAEALSTLSHPNIVTVTDFGVDGDTPFLVMELLEGRDLARLVAGPPIDPARGLALLRQVVRALAYAHERGLVHRDLKPHNVFVRELEGGSDHVTVLDFGLARFLGPPRGPQLTRIGALIGTPAYMAPEQASGEPADARADVYAAGVVLFETLTGRRPFLAEDPGDVLRAHLLLPVPRLTAADQGLAIDPALDALLASALAKEPGDRFADGRALLAALDALPEGAARRIGPRVDGTPARRPVAPTQAGVSDVPRGLRPGVRPSAGSAAVTLSADPPAPGRVGPVTGPLGRGPAGGGPDPDGRAPALGAGAAHGERSGQAEGASGSVPTHTGRWLRVAAVLALVAVVGGAGVYAVRRIGLAPPASVPEGTPAAPGPAPAGTGSAADARRAPLAEPLPEPLATYHRRVEAGESVGAADDRALYAFLRSHPEDARPHLLLGRSRVDRRLLTEALQAFDRALALDPSVRSDPALLPDLLEIAMVRRDDALRARAFDLVTEQYGAAAIHTIDAVLEEGFHAGHERRLRADERAHLLALRHRLDRSAPTTATQP
ncbi:MAG: protein kinase [Sandaracinaceae bacterium]